MIPPPSRQISYATNHRYFISRRILHEGSVPGRREILSDRKLIKARASPESLLPLVDPLSNPCPIAARLNHLNEDDVADKVRRLQLPR